VAAGIIATLDGSSSNDPDEGDIISYHWEQTAGQTVTLNNSTAKRAKFTVPQGPDTLIFQLTVSDLLNTTATASVTLTVVTEPKVRLITTKGEIVLDMLDQEAPITTTNFMQYVEDGFYDSTIFHRVVKDFVV